MPKSLIKSLKKHRYIFVISLSHKKTRCLIKQSINRYSLFKIICLVSCLTAEYTRAATNDDRYQQHRNRDEERIPALCTPITIDLSDPHLKIRPQSPVTNRNTAPVVMVPSRHLDTDAHTDHQNLNPLHHSTYLPHDHCMAYNQK